MSRGLARCREFRLSLLFVNFLTFVSLSAAKYSVFDLAHANFARGKHAQRFVYVYDCTGARQKQA